MAERTEVVEEWLAKAAAAEVVVFDLDGTLIESDLANFLSYEAALIKFARPYPQLTFDPKTRMTREIVKDVIKENCETKLAKIVLEKDRLYKNYLHKTKLNIEIANILIQCIGKQVVLTTNSRKERADSLLEYHGLFGHFTRKYYKENIYLNNKYQQIFDNYDGKSIVIFENEANEIEAAVSAGAEPENIILVQRLW